jgi:hypothetical protein
MRRPARSGHPSLPAGGVTFHRLGGPHWVEWINAAARPLAAEPGALPAGI